MAFKNLSSPFAAVYGADIISFANNSRWTGGAGWTLDAVGEKVMFFGSVWLKDRGSGKTLSSSGGKIVWRTNSVTWASSGTTLRVGMQAPSTSTVPVVPSGTWLTYRDYVQGTDTLASNTVYESAMTDGSVTLSHGTFMCVVIEMTARSGTDSVSVYGTTNNYNWKYAPMTRNYTTYWNTSSTEMNVHFICDDGTPGFFWGTCPGLSQTSETYINNSTMRCAGIKFRLPYSCYCEGMYALLGVMENVNADIVAKLAEGPLTTSPTVVRTSQTIDGAFLAPAGNHKTLALFWEPVLLKANTDYGLYLEFVGTSSYQNLVKQTFFSATARDLMCGDVRAITRAGTSGAFTEDASNVTFAMIPLLMSADVGPVPGFQIGV